MALPFNMTHNEVYRGIRASDLMFRQIARGDRTLGLACGGSGIGKNYRLERTCHRHNIRDLPTDRPRTASALVNMTSEHRDKPVHVLNECDGLLQSEECQNLLKVMHEQPRRCVHYTTEARRNEEFKLSGSKQYRESIPPTSFDLHGNARHALLSNTNYTDAEVVSQLPQQHWKALIRRGLIIVWTDIEANEGRDLFQYVVWEATENHMLGNHEFTYDVARRR
jgi:hypothetical protein